MFLRNRSGEEEAMDQGSTTDRSATSGETTAYDEEAANDETAEDDAFGIGISV